MNVLQNQGLPSNGAPPRGSRTSHLTAASLINDALNAGAQSRIPSLNPHKDARAIIRLVQCSQCSLPFQNPLTLPCGNSLCRKCLPPVRQREHISYPNIASRQEGFTCPFLTCRKDHALGDCCQDVTLSKIVERISVEASKYRLLTPETPTLLDERLRWKNMIDSSKDERKASSRIINGGRLLATYTLAEYGQLRYDSEVAYQTMSSNGDTYEILDIKMLNHLKETIKNELDCQVCYALMLDPLTTNCGHTYCRKCVARILDHSSLCPICRRSLQMPPGATGVASNHSLSKLLLTLCPDLLAARQEAADKEETMQGDTNVPLFVCTLAYPAMPTFLHVFEPRYRLMMRRAVENGDRKFGMIMYNHRGEAQGNLGHSHFMEYGTMLHINTIQMMPDGRSVLETRGVFRFRVKSSGELDGYIIGNIEPVQDISLAEEEAIEARETTLLPAMPDDMAGQIDRMSTLELLHIGTDFIARTRAASAPWLRGAHVASYGEMPLDPALFPYWFASVLPINEDEKYRLLPTTSVRERLKITARWVKKIEAQNWDELDDADLFTSDSSDDETPEAEDEASGEETVLTPPSRQAVQRSDDPEDEPAAATERVDNSSPIDGPDRAPNAERE
ncbi:uncharacterized protein KY384_005485 [Bacidia gigantensis]|uniref:uncharacterized protein n=1 Tax=Bacidia gigantensis TaxID=2732470 RepID=UPI001D045532|nr:uncharacterized protein KY384_005485 [Bacidia gigantensis]KAG8530003.1 hypothetical protein KY384_005485 [Bacidia gigantensis]